MQKRDFPHLLVHGPSGAGKKTRILCILKELYGVAAERLKIENMQFEVINFCFVSITLNYNLIATVLTLYYNS